MNIFEVTQEFLDEKGFLFLDIEVVDYFKEQLKNGIYIDSGFCGEFTLNNCIAIIDGMKFETGKEAYNYFKNNKDYTLLEKNITWNTSDNFIKKIYVYRNISINIKSLYDIKRNINKIIGIKDNIFNEGLLMDINILFYLIKRPNSISYKKMAERYMHEERISKKNLEIELNRQKEKNKELRVKNQELKEENRILKEKVKKGEKINNILYNKSKKLINSLNLVSSELENLING